MSVRVETVWNWQDKLDSIPRDEWSSVIWLKTRQIEKLLDFNVGSALDIVDELREHKAWETHGLPDLESLIRSIAKIEPEAIETIRQGYKYLKAKGVTGPITGAQAEAAAQTMRVTPEQAPNLLPAEYGRMGGRGKKANSVTTGFPKRDIGYLAARLKRDRPDIADAVERGEYRSIRAAALAAGIVRPRMQVPADVDAMGAYLCQKLSRDELARLAVILHDALHS